jgi:hypothetical protein
MGGKIFEKDLTADYTDGRGFLGGQQLNALSVQSA